MNWDELMTWCQWAVAVAAAVVFLWICVPHLLLATGLDFFRNGARGGPADNDPEGKGEVYADLHSQLLALGFEPFGVYWEKVIFKPRSEEFMFLHRASNDLATVTRLAGGDPRASFVTVFISGAAVFTASYSRPREEDDDYLANGFPTTALDAVLAAHRHAVNEFKDRGLKPVELTSLADVVRAERTYFYNPAVRRAFQKNYSDIFLLHAGFLIVPPAAVALVCWCAGMPMVLAWLVLLGMGLYVLREKGAGLQQELEHMTAEQRAGRPLPREGEEEL